MTCDVIEVGTRVREVFSEVSCEVWEVSCALVSVGVLVEVLNSVVVEPADVGVVITVVGVVGAVVGSVVGSLSVVGSEVTLPPVDSGGFWRLNRAMASSRGSATACEASSDETSATETTLKCLIVYMFDSAGGKNVGRQSPTKRRSPRGSDRLEMDGGVRVYKERMLKQKCEENG